MILSITIAITIITVATVSFGIGRTLKHREIDKLKNECNEHIVQLERDKLLVKGEQIGYEKGLEAGRAEARGELRDMFIVFLEEQIRILKNEQ